MCYIFIVCGLQKENEPFRQRCSANETALSESKRAYDKLTMESHSLQPSLKKPIFISKKKVNASRNFWGDLKMREM